jgi:hypothetical protein
VDLVRSPSRARRLATIRVNLVSRAIEQRIATLSQVARFLYRDSAALSRLLTRHGADRASISQ